MSDPTERFRVRSSSGNANQYAAVTRDEPTEFVMGFVAFSDEEVFVMPREYAEHRATLNRAVLTSFTWGEFFDAIDTQTRIDLLEYFDEGERTKDLESTFDFEDLPLMGEGCWPDMHDEHLGFMPRAVRAKPLHQEWSGYDPNDAPSIAQDLVSEGHTVKVDQRLILRALTIDKDADALAYKWQTQFASEIAKVEQLLAGHRSPSDAPG